MFCGSKDTVKSLGEFLIKNKLSYQTEYKKNIGKAQLILTSEELFIGASFLECGIVLIGTSELVKRTVKPPQAKNKKRTAMYLPKLGEYVVHNIHGIGKCVDIKKLNLNGTIKDYFIVEYKNGDLLYLPSEQANTISAYLGGEKPVLNKIGGQEFSKIKEKVKTSVKALAIDLVKLYKERESLKGFKFDSSNYLMELFENAFEYDLTEDQAQAVLDIKSDMYSGKVMDRLICGDVGYGKTEVAIRAAFKACMDSKQVVYLAPTTILAQQQYESFKERMKDYPINIDILNRFRTKKEQEEVIKNLELGKIDILIGTHRVLSKDVKFKNLGLLIIDEEHRFGVKDKEKIKQLKTTVDVLTMTATPIPRTLHMSIVGIRDMSVIYEPPQDRKPVQTYVLEYDDDVISEAITKEIERGGQVFYLFNNVEQIMRKAENIAEYIEACVNECDEELTVEEIQNYVENGLMSLKRKDVAKAYILYRDERTITDKYMLSRYQGHYNDFTGEGFSFNKIQNPELLGLNQKAITSDWYAYLAAIRQFANPVETDINVLATPGIDYVNNQKLVEEVIEMVEVARKLNSGSGDK